jgi:alpha-N-arabinofuranosidase
MSTSTAQVFVDTNRTIAPISPLLFGGFAEHMGRCVYEGIYDPESPHADEHGLRKDVMGALRDQSYTVIRYPGGNFLSGYNWLDGVGPKAQRPRRRELAWQSVETNQFGTNEFIEFCAAINAAPMLGVNMGTGDIQSASDLVEYCNVSDGTYWSDLRVSHGFRNPHDVRYWCVGNEMDGFWQIGHLDAAAYGNKALEAAKMMKWQDPTIETILCGSSNDRMPTYPEWDRIALEIAWEHWADWFRFMKSMSISDQGMSRLNWVCRCTKGFCSTFRPAIHILAGENVCIQVISPTQFSALLASIHSV